MNAPRFLLPAVLIAVLAGCATAPNPAESRALAVLGSSNDLHEKARACQELGAAAGPASVTALAALLDHEQLADYARSGLEGIPSPAAGKALRDALPRLEGRQLAGVINSLGVRREQAAVPELRALALDPSRGVAEEALASLGMIGTRDAAQALQQILATGPAGARIPAVHAALVAAEHLVREGHGRAARELLEAVGGAQPPGHILAVAESRAAALRGR